MKIGLFFGSFNPIHIGHLVIAEFMSQFLDEVWLVLSPQNPFKKTTELLCQEERLAMIKLALNDHPTIKVSTVEFDLPKPSYTYKTLEYLHENYPNHDFSLIMGADNILGIHHWKHHELILSHNINVYPRYGYDVDGIPIASDKSYQNVAFTEAPIMEVSSTKIRASLAAGDHEISYFLREKVWDYIIEKGHYQENQP